METKDLRVQPSRFEAPFTLSPKATDERDALIAAIESHNADCERLALQVNELTDAPLADFGEAVDTADELRAEKIHLAAEALALRDQIKEFQRVTLKAEQRIARQAAINAKQQAILDAKRKLAQVFDCNDRDIARWVETQAVQRHPDVIAAGRNYEACNSYGRTFNTTNDPVARQRRALEDFVGQARKQALAI